MKSHIIGTKKKSLTIGYFFIFVDSMKRKIFILLFLIINTLPIFGQNKSSIFGVVRDTEGNPLTGVTIYIESIQGGTSTDIDGKYEITLPDGEYEFRFSFVGYITQNHKIKVARGSKKFNVMLQADNEMLQEVVISSKRADANIKEMAMSVQKLEMKQIKKIPALLGEVDVIKAVQLLPGVQAASEGSSGLTIRGGSPDQNLVLFDDAPIYNASHFLGFFSVFNNNVVKDATLYKGDIPTSYSSRLSSVLDVSTYDEVFDVPTINGGIGILTSHLTIKTPIFRDKTSIMLGGRTTYAGLFLPFLGENLKDKNLYFFDLNAKITHVFNKNNRLYISGYYGNDMFKMSGTASINYGNAAATARWNHIFNSKTTSNLSLIFSDYTFNVDVITNPFNWNVTTGIRDYTAKYDVSILWNDNITSKLGVSTTLHKINLGKLKDEGGAITVYFELDNDWKSTRNTLEHAVYFTNDHKITEAFSIRYGLRLSFFQNMGEEKFFKFNEQHQQIGEINYKDWEIFHTEWNLEPRFAMKYELSPLSSVKASYSRTVQYAQVASKSTGGLPLDVWFPANPNIKPQLCHQFAAGYFRNLFDNKIETSVEAYYKILDNVIDFLPDADLIANDEIDGEIRSGKGRSYGIEVLIRKDVGKLTGWFSYTYSRSFRTIKEINFGDEYNSPFDHPHCISIVLNYPLSHSVDISANWVYSTGQPVTAPYAKYSVGGQTYAIYNGSRNRSRYPDYHRLDMSLTWKVPTKRRWQSEWNFSIYNAYGRHNTWAIIFDTGEGETVDTKKIYLFTIIPSVSYNFKF